MAVTYEEIITRAIHNNMLLQEHLERALTPFEPELPIGWICTRDMWGYICSEAHGEITVAEWFDVWLEAREIRYRGLPVHIRNAAGDTEDEDRFFPAVILKSIEQGFIDRLSPGTRILHGTHIYEVVEAPANSNALTLFAATLSGHAADEAFSAGVYAGRIRMSDTHLWYDRQTGISDEPIRADCDFDRAWDRERARDLYLRYTGRTFGQGTSSMELRYDHFMKRDILAGEWAGDWQTEELGDNFESADLSILFGEQPNE